MSEPSQRHMSKAECDALVGRVVLKGGINYTVQSASSYGTVCVWNPVTNTLFSFASKEAFEHWAYGTPISAGAER